MSGSSFTQKKIDVVFTIVNGSTSSDLTITGHRVACQIVNSGLDTGVMCSLRIEGMQLSDMNRLSIIQAGIVAQSLNTVTVKAGDSSAPLATVFQGGVIEGFVDYGNAPNVAFVVTALSMSIPGAQPITPTSYPSGAAVADIVQAIATKAGLNFQNNGVIQYLSGSLYFWGTAADQLAAVAAASRISYCIASSVLSIWPPGTLQSGSSAIDVSATSGLLGYPAYSQYGVALRLLFNPNIGFRSTINLKSNYSPAAWVNGQGQLNKLGGQNVYPASDGTWVVVNVQHDIQSETPSGTWETNLVAARPDFAGSIAFAN